MCADKMYINKEQFVVHHGKGTSIVELCYTGNSFVNLYVDDKLIDSIKITHFLNFEYEFNIYEKKCSIVKLVTDKTVGFVIDGEYQNKNRKYAKITKTPLLTWIALVIDLFVLIAYVIYAFSVDLILYYKIFLIMIFVMFSLALTYFIRVVCNSPCAIKNPTHNWMLRCFLIIIIEIAFAFLSLGMFNWINIFN